ncbi:MAG: 50S ribosomal protein L6 [Candidatus Dojkabacteria bacterium]|nr:50S ribosomal protein L6 [Candidatus Dojkabacteria bacterium]MDQ7021375.1 50S ribosomal protein L6 [Candidatus Dojkabacteria bacterium]
MSRVGYSPIKLPNGVTVEVKDGGDFEYKEVFVTGPKGSLSRSIRRGVSILIEGDTVKLERDNEAKQTKSYHGLYRSLIEGMVTGVSEGYKKKLEIVGIGYRAESNGNTVIFSVGYSHKIELTPPEGITITVEDQTKVTVEGYDKQKVGEIAAKIRAYRKPEPYKGKGIKYADEQIRRKSAKSASAG